MAGTVARRAPSGGQLRTGNPGNRGGPGRTPSIVRERLLQILANRTDVVDEIASGKVMQRMRIPVRQLSKYVTCANCGEQQIMADSPESAEVEVEVEVSASVKDRLAAIDAAAKYSIGAVKGVSEESVRQRVNQTLDVLQVILPPDLFREAVRAIKPVWTA